MIEELYIDNLNAFTEFGVRLADNSYKSIVQYAALKEVEVVDWHEYDGVDADLTNPVLDTRSLSIPFFCVDSKQTNALIELLSAGSYHDFRFVQLGKTFRLRLTSQKQRNTIETLQLFSLDFYDDFPLSDYTYVDPTMTGISDGFSLDTKDFSNYGIRILEGTMDEILKSPEVKQNQLVSLKIKSGVIYDSVNVVYKAKDVSLSLFLNTADIATFWKCYNAFLFDLIRSGERNLSVEETAEGYQCYYKNSTCSEFEILGDGSIWCEFSVNVVFTSFRNKVIEIIKLFSFEDNNIFSFEDNYMLDYE